VTNLPLPITFVEREVASRRFSAPLFPTLEMCENCPTFSSTTDEAELMCSCGGCVVSQVLLSALVAKGALIILHQFCKCVLQEALMARMRHTLGSNLRPSIVRNFFEAGPSCT
jgi:hypothetical protein